MTVRLLPLLRRCAFAFLVALFGSLFLSAQPKPSADPEAVFAAPPESAKPWVFWYWMKGAISREGITADLEAFARAGIGGVYLVPIQDVPNPALFEPSVRTLTPEWWAMLRHAFSGAARLKLKIAMHASDGFATAGGPWITPELAMQQVVWTEQQVDGGAELNVKLAQPAIHDAFYRDVVVLAFPARDGAGISSRNVMPKVTTDVVGADAQALAVPGNTKRLRSEAPCWIQYEFPKPFICRSIVVRPDGANYPALRMIVEVSDDGKTFCSLGHLETPRHGWQDWDAPYTFSIPTTTARFFRFVHDPSGAEPFAEDLDSAKWKHIFKVQGIELFSDARIPHYEGKSGAVWRLSSRADAKLIPDELCIPQEKIIDLTSSLTADGQLKWQAPVGRWTILRIGHTATGHRNETAGAGRGLECDKFNPAAARLQFDKWFGETIRQVGPELAGKVLKVFHVDSWEAGSQNWTATFREEFKKRRGYDLTPYLPLFAGIPVESAEKSESVLHDVRQTISDLTIVGFFEPLAELARENGCTFTAETTAPTMMGEGMRHFGLVDVPTGEFWLKSAVQDKPNDVHDAISGARIYGKPIVMSEAFTQRNMEWNEHPGMLKALGDHNFALGVNKFLIHVAALNPWLDRKPGMTLSNIGLFYGREQTWFEQSKAWISYLSRCSALLQLGTPVVDVAYFEGEALPARAILPERRKPELPPGFQADTINCDALLRLASVKEGRIVLPGGASYAVLIVDDGEAHSAAVQTKLEQLRAAGATVLDARSADLKTTFKKAKLGPDCIISDIHAAPVEKAAWTHRRFDGGDLYFVANLADASREIVVKLRVGVRVPRFLDAVTGKPSRAIRRWVGGSKETEAQFVLAPHESVFIVFGEEKTSEEKHFGGYDLVMASGNPIAGPWQLTFPKTGGADGTTLTLTELVSWSDLPKDHLRAFSGTATYTTTFDWQPASDAGVIELDLGRVENIAEVQLNGVDCGSVWTPPLRVDVTQALRRGENRLEIRVTNTWHNRLAADAAEPEARRTTFLTGLRPTSSLLLPAGLLGPVQLFVSANRPTVRPIPAKLRGAPHPVSTDTMQRIFEEVKTPHKYGVVIPVEKGEMVDCPNIFRKDGRWYMMFVSIRDQIGYQTELARSDDLLHWERLGVILPHAKTGWDAWQGDGGLALYDTHWNGDHQLGTHDGKFWLSYIGGAQHGYEPDPLAIGMAWTQNPSAGEPWNRHSRNPVLSTFQPDVRPFESVTLYKSAIVRDEAQSLGWPFVMFYNGKTKTGNHEAIGMAVSMDLVNWTRLGTQPVVDNAPGKAAITGDPQITRIGDVWVMFYFGFRWLERTTAFDTFACSHDLVNWTKWDGEPLVKPSEPFDKTFAHKPWVIKHDGVVYHFYCAVGSEGRVIALATSKDLRSIKDKISATAKP